MPVEYAWIHAVGGRIIGQWALQLRAIDSIRVIDIALDYCLK